MKKNPIYYIIYIALSLLLISSISISQLSPSTTSNKNFAMRDSFFFTNIVNGVITPTGIGFYHDSAGNKIVFFGPVDIPGLIGGGGGGGGGSIKSVTNPLKIVDSVLSLGGLAAYGPAYSLLRANTTANAVEWTGLTGTSNQIDISTTPSGFTFSTPQNIDGSANILFNTLTLGSYWIKLKTPNLSKIVTIETQNTGFNPIFKFGTMNGGTMVTGGRSFFGVDITTGEGFVDTVNVATQYDIRLLPSYIDTTSIRSNGDSSMLISNISITSNSQVTALWIDRDGRGVLGVKLYPSVGFVVISHTDELIDWNTVLYTIVKY